jgi:putative SOS response-associated peptidase YedK
LISQNAAFDVLAERFGIEVVDAGTKELFGRYNLAPSQLVPIVIAPDGRRRLLPARWGFRPLWARYGKIAPTHIRAEVVVTRQVFRDTLRFTRCLVPADGFYEWKSIPGQRRKQPYYFRLKGETLFAFAGLYTPSDPKEGVRATCAIITTTPNKVTAPIHSRMPVILDPSDEGRWLNPFFVTPIDVLRCLLPLAADRMEAYRVSTLASSPQNEGGQLMEPVSTTSGAGRGNDDRALQSAIGSPHPPAPVAPVGSPARAPWGS